MRDIGRPRPSLVTLMQSPHAVEIAFLSPARTLSRVGHALTLGPQVSVPSLCLVLLACRYAESRWSCVDPRALRVRPASLSRPPALGLVSGGR